MNARLVFVVGFLCLFAGVYEVEAQAKTAAQLFEEAQRLHIGLDGAPDYRGAYGLYQQVVKQDPRHKDAYYNMAHITFAQKRYDLAAKYYRQVLRIDTQDLDTRNNLGTVLFLQGNHKAAKAEYLKVIKADRDFARAYYNLAILYLQEDDKKRAEKLLEEALRIEPENPEYVRMYAQLKGDAGPITAGAALAVVSGFAGIVVGYYFLFGRKGI